MPILDVPGVFAMLVPEGWDASVEGRTYQLTRLGADGAVDISAYERARSALRDDEAAGLVAGFMSAAHAPSQGEFRVFKESRRQHRAVARFRTPGEHGEVDWLVLVVLWRTAFVACSCTARPGSPLLDEAHTMFATIYPPRRGLFRRW